MTSMTTAYDAVTVSSLTGYPPEAEVQIVEGTIYLRRAGGFDPADLDRLPDDNRRHELVDGVIVVSPSPLRRHQRALIELAARLREAAPGQLEVLVAPFDVAANRRSVVEPDIVVLPRDETERPVPPPPLAVEVLSPSNRGYDLVTKRRLYQGAGVPSYWLVDPVEPSLTVLELRDGDYVEAGRAVGAESITVSAPFEFTVRPADLV